MLTLIYLRPKGNEIKRTCNIFIIVSKIGQTMISEKKKLKKISRFFKQDKTKYIT